MTQNTATEQSVSGVRLPTHPSARASLCGARHNQQRQVVLILSSSVPLQQNKPSSCCAYHPSPGLDCSLGLITNSCSWPVMLSLRRHHFVRVACISIGHFHMLFGQAWRGVASLLCVFSVSKGTATGCWLCLASGCIGLQAHEVYLSGGVGGAEDHVGLGLCVDL